MKKQYFRLLPVEAYRVTAIHTCEGDQRPYPDVSIILELENGDQFGMRDAELPKDFYVSEGDYLITEHGGHRTVVPKVEFEHSHVDVSSSPWTMAGLTARLRMFSVFAAFAR